MSLDDVDKLTAEDAATLSASEPDPIDEDPSSEPPQPLLKRTKLTSSKGQTALANQPPQRIPHSGCLYLAGPAAHNKTPTYSAQFGLWAIQSSLTPPLTVSAYASNALA